MCRCTTIVSSAVMAVVRGSRREWIWGALGIGCPAGFEQGGMIEGLPAQERAPRVGLSLGSDQPAAL